MRQAFSYILTTISLLLGITTFATATTIQGLEIHEIGPGHKPVIAADHKGQLYAVFERYEKTSQIQDIYCSTSKDGGLSWTPAGNISQTPGVSSHPDIAVEKNGAIDVVWSDTTSGQHSPDIFFIRSTDSGKTWTHALDISNTPGESSEPAIAIGPNNSIHVVWTDTSKGEKNQDIYYSYSVDNGKKWGKNPLLPADDISNTPGKSTQPAIAVGLDGIVHTAWLDSTPDETHPTIYYAQKSADGWREPINVSQSTYICAHPDIACGEKGRIYLIWSDSSKKHIASDIWCAMSSGDQQLTKPINISNMAGASYEPSVAANHSGEVAIVWSDTSDLINKRAICARISTDDAANLSKVLNISNSVGISRHPDVIIVDKNMIVIWEEAQSTKCQVKMATINLKDTLATGQPVH